MPRQFKRSPAPSTRTTLHPLALDTTKASFPSKERSLCDLFSSATSVTTRFAKSPGGLRVDVRLAAALGASGAGFGADSGEAASIALIFSGSRLSEEGGGQFVGRTAGFLTVRREQFVVFRIRVLHFLPDVGVGLSLNHPVS